MPRRMALAAPILLVALLASACSPSYRIMRRATDDRFPGSRGDAARYQALLAAWTRTEPLGVHSEASVTMFDPSLGADKLAYDAQEEHREIQQGYDKGVWDGWYGDRRDRIPFDVTWRFDKLFQPERIINPRVGWTFTLYDDHGRSFSPLYVGEQTQGPDPDAWTASFRVWFATEDVLKGPLFDGRTGSVTLRLSGEPGVADFVWKFRPELGAPDGD